MEKENIYITVAGRCASGKSRILYLLKHYLKVFGFEVEFNGTLDFVTEQKFDSQMQKNIDGCIESFKDSRKIIFAEKQLHHDCVKLELSSLYGQFGENGFKLSTDEFKKVFVKSKEDLPKVSDSYFTSNKYDLKSVLAFDKDSLESISYWLNFVNWYLI